MDMEVEKRDHKDLIAAGITFLVMGLIVAALFLWKLVIPIPPFPETTLIELELGGGDIGNMIEGQGNVDSPGMGNDIGNNSNSAPVDGGSQQEESYLGNEANQPTAVKASVNPTSGNSVASQPQTDSELDAALNAFENSKGNSSGGDGNAGQPGDKGSPDGHPDGGDGKGPRSGTGWSLKGRKMVRMPDRVTDSQEEGKVVVAIIVDKYGNVIEATPGEPGSTTTSAMLYMKARQAARTAKFSPSPEGMEEQYGTITFVFVLQ